ncbi:MAG: hypothetical protein V2A73_22650, partial [Pseudomonadota bacterium]
SDRFARIAAETALAETPANAILIVESDHWVWPLLYLQEVERKRRDVALLPNGLASSSWYWEFLYRKHPDLRPIVLRGPGGPIGRVIRFLDANPARPLMFERLDLAAPYQRAACLKGWLAATGEACAGNDPPDRRPATVLAEQLALLGSGSPPTGDLIALLALERGVALWRLGHAELALEALLAGVPSELRILLPPPPTAETLAGAPAYRDAIPAWERPVALGDPARNLFFAAMLRSAAGDIPGAHRSMILAATLELPEALLTLARMKEALPVEAER